MEEEQNVTRNLEDEPILDELVKNYHAKMTSSEKLDSAIELVDIDNISYSKTSLKDQQKTITSIFSSKPSFQVVCTQSGYMAKLTSMVYKDIVAIMNSNLSTYESRKETYKILYSKITGYSADKWKPSFDEWLAATSIGDIETLFYGLYCATFQNKSTIKFKCPWCGKMSTIEIDNSKLIRVNDRKEMLELTKEISKEADTVERIKEFSMVSNKKENIKYIKLPDTKIIFGIKVPSLLKVLEVLKSYDEEALSAASDDAAQILLYTDSVSLPNDDGTYSKVETKEDVLPLINLLGVNDISVLNRLVFKLVEDKRISYCVDKPKCGECHKEIEKIPLDIESLLFFQISEKQL